MTDDLEPRPQSALPRRLQRRLEEAREAELGPRTPSVRRPAAPSPDSSSRASSTPASPRPAEPRVPGSSPAAGRSEAAGFAPAAASVGDRTAPAAADPAGRADAAGTPIVPPRFIPSRNPQLAAREDERRRRLEEDRAARSTSADAGLAPAAAAIPPAERAARKARRRFLGLVLTAAAAVAILAFVLGAVLDPFRSRGPSAEELATSAVAHPQPTGVPAAALRAGQCLASFPGAWAAEFEPADCTGDHAAQLVATVPADPYAGGAYPGEEALRSRAQFACQAKTVLDTAAASAYEDLVVDVAYAPSALEWDAGQQSYSCFVARSGGGMLQGSLAAS